MNSQTCKICGSTKPLNEFYKNSTYTTGHESRCKECRKAYQADLYLLNLEDKRQYSRKYYHKNKEQRSKYRSEWYQKNKNKNNQYHKEWRRNNPERSRAQRKIENSRRRARIENAAGNYTTSEWMKLKEKYDSKCLACDRSEPEVKITPDHVIPLALGGSNDIDNIQPLCWGCNASKRSTIRDYRGKNNN